MLYRSSCCFITPLPAEGEQKSHRQMINGLGCKVINYFLGHFL